MLFYAASAVWAASPASPDSASEAASPDSAAWSADSPEAESSEAASAEDASAAASSEDSSSVWYCDMSTAYGSPAGMSLITMSAPSLNSSNHAW